MTSQHTRAVRAGEGALVGTGAPHVPAIHQTTVHEYSSIEALEAVYTGDEPGFIYYRMGHVNGTVLEATLAGLEGAPAAAVGASGMAVISAVYLGVLRPGDHVVADRNAYGGTYTLLTAELPNWGISCTFVDAADLVAVVAAITPATRLVHVEALTNPTMRVADIPALVEVCRRHDVKLLVDATFASPALVRPIELGADLVVHSLAKYIGGHSVGLGGAVAGRRELVEAARLALVRFGGTIGPFDAWLVLQGVRTLPLRMKAHSANACAVAAFLGEHAKVTRVDHPSVPSHPHHALAARLYPHGTGGMLSFEVVGGYEGASRFVRAAAPAIPLSPSLAGVSTTLSYPTTTSHRALTPEARAAIGVTPGLLRLSVGIEDTDDIIDDLTRGLDAV